MENKNLENIYNISSLMLEYVQGVSKKRGIWVSSSFWRLLEASN